MKSFLFLLLFPLLSFSQIQIGDDIDGEGAGDQCGHSVSLSSDGTIVAIGSRYNRTSGGIFDAPGHVRIYENTGGIWSQIGNDIDGEASGDLSGSSVSLSSDGTIVAIGAPNNFGANGFGSGHVRVYENQGGSWTQIGNDIDGERSGDRSGRKVSLSDDGSIVAISALGNNENGSNSGHVRIYENQGGSWTQLGSDIDGEFKYNQMGNSISLSASGTIIAISAIGSGSITGQIRVYEYNSESDVWNQLGADFDPEDTGDEFDEYGDSASLSSDGSIIAIGAPDNDDNGSNSGHVRVYEYDSTSEIWTQIGDDIDGEAADNLSGSNVSLSSDGSIVAIGAHFNYGVNGLWSGHVRVYKNQDGSWTQIGTDIDGEDASDLSGFNVSLSSDGSIVAIGAIHNDGNGTESGHTRVFDLSALLSVDEFNQLSFELYPNPAKNQFIIQLQNGQELEQVNIYNNLGQLVKTVETKLIKTTNLATGLYYVEVITNTGKATKKLVIE